MEIYLIVVIVLALLATSNLWVGVANDAVNFLGPAIGSKSASFKVVMLVAAVGMVVGVTFSSGMMEVARSGIVHPEMFLFKEIIIIFLAYAIGDLILLDMFNTFGLPTSTTVSLIFGLVGSGVVVSILKIMEAGADIATLEQYINTSKVLSFASAIIISVVLSFIVGAIAQYLSRLLFTFDYEKKFKRWGGIWSGFAVTFISYFILVKGLKGASFITPETAAWVGSHTGLVMLLSFVFWSSILQIFISFTKINVLKFIVLVGTFALAMAFAANDLVNFLGAPLAGISAYMFANASADPFGISMQALNDPYRANTLILLAAGLIMVVVLYVSKKSKTVIKLAVGLSSQEDEVERFQSFGAARGLVRSVINTFDGIIKITPQPIKQYVTKRFDKTLIKPHENPNEPAPQFDLIRAAVNLMVAAALISLGTSLKLPLSTTYVTFIVGMGTALSDKAWGRDTAVYRVSGVLSVIGGWFVTAIMASLIAGTIALIIWYFSFAGMAVMAGTAMFVVFKNSVLHKKREKEFDDKEKLTAKHNLTKEELFDGTNAGIAKQITNISSLLSLVNEGISEYNLKTLKLAKLKNKESNKNADLVINYVSKAVKKFDKEELNRSHNFTDLIGYINVLTSLSRRMTFQATDYVDNNHKKMTDIQLKELRTVTNTGNALLNSLQETISSKEYFNESLNMEFDAMKCTMNEFKSNQAKRVIEGNSSSWQNLLYLSYFDYLERLVLNSMKLAQALKKFFN